MTSDGDLLPVRTSRLETQRTYDRLSSYYDRTEGLFERRARRLAVAAAAPTQGETVLEIGSGTGRALTGLAAAVGPSGLVCGIDLSPGMLHVARTRIGHEPVALLEGDATSLPLRGSQFDLVFMSFVLELLPTEDIQPVLAEVHRVLRPGGRIAVLSLSRVRPNLMTQLWELGHRAFPHLLDCRPIYVARAVRKAGFEVSHAERILIWGLPAEIVVGNDGSPPAALGSG